jgi:hypothetical protein
VLEELLVNPSFLPNVPAAAFRTVLELAGAIGSRTKAEQDQ